MDEACVGGGAPGLRRQSGGGARPLPTLSDLTSDDTAYLQEMLALAETGAMFRGRYVEAHVARLLGAVLPETGINEWDLMIPEDPPIFLEVKASGPTGRFDLTRIGRANDLVWVFVRIDSPMGERPSEFTYAVAGPVQRKEIAGRFGRSVRVDRLVDEIGCVPAEDLPAVIRRRGGPR